MEQIFQVLDANKLTVMMYSSHDCYVSESKRWRVEIESRDNDERIKVERFAPTAVEALRLAYEAFERIALMGKPAVLAPIIEHRPLREALNDDISY